MIPGFEEQTEPLSDYELKTLLPVIVQGIQKKVGAKSAVTNKTIVAGMLAQGYKINAVKVRKLVNHIRTHDLIPCLIAKSKGYYISNDPEEVRSYIESLRGREEAIKKVRRSIESHLANMKR